MRIVGWGLAAALLALAPMAQAQTLADARSFVSGLYRAYEHAQPDYLGPHAREVFTPRLLALIRRDARNADGEVGALDGDPICDCQDPGGLQLAGVQISDAGPGRAVARVRLHFDGGVDAIRLDLMAVRGQWRVDDVHTANTSSLVKLLSGRSRDR